MRVVRVVRVVRVIRFIRVIRVIRVRPTHGLCKGRESKRNSDNFGIQDRGGKLDFPAFFFAVVVVVVVV